MTLIRNANRLSQKSLMLIQKFIKIFFFILKKYHKLKIINLSLIKNKIKIKK